ncbi:MAG: Sensor histidine kinase, partial [Caulobacteraceae bacterium]|nr:Sensor histidine kinase [Caulobacteraceae bacterium]
AALERRVLLYACACAAVMLCATALVEHATDLDFDVDLLLSRNALLHQPLLAPHAGRAGIASSLIFLCLNASFVLSSLKSRTWRLWSMALATLVLMFTVLPLSENLILHAMSFATFTRAFGVTLLDATGGILLGVGALILTRDMGWPRLLTKDDEQGRIIRLTLPIALMPSIAAFVVNWGMSDGFYSANERLLLITGLSTATLLPLLFWAGQRLGLERTERQELSSALELSAVFVRSKEGRIEHWPLGCEVLYGWTAAEAVGRISHELLQTEFPSPIADIEAALERDREWRGDLRHLTPRGDVRWVAAHWMMQERNSPAAPRVVEIVNDITDLKRKDAALLLSEARLAQAVAGFGLGIVEFNPNTGICTFSPGIERMLGLPIGSMGSDIEDWRCMYAPGERERVADESAVAVLEQRSLVHDCVRVRHQDGGFRDLQTVRNYIFSATGEYIGAIGIFKDVTDQLRDRVEVEARGERLLTLQAELTHVSRLSAMGEMAAALAHELNQPLTAIGNSVGAIGMMLERTDGPLEPEARERILRATRHTEAQAVRAGEIVRRLREFIARGEADSRAENLGHLMTDAVALAMPNPLAAAVEVQQVFSAKVEEVLADRIQIQQVIVNLIRNAVEAMREQTTPRILTISTVAKGGMAEICLCDNGPGVSPEVAERLFSPFVSTKSNGMGVGLSICMRIVEAHGGKMWADRSPSGGAAFYFTLPLIRIEARHGR